MKIPCQELFSSATLISLVSGFHSAFNEKILHRVSKTPGLDHPAPEELTRAFLSAADRANTPVQSSAQRSRDE